LLRRVFVLEARIDVANEMVIIIVTDYHLLYLAILAHLAPEVLIECVEVILELARVHLVLRIVGRVLIKIRK